MSTRADTPDHAPAPPVAVALRYERNSESAPAVVASGRGELAQRILEFARASGVPVREDADLVELLAACDVGETIPVELYDAVARLLTVLYRMNDELVRGAESSRDAARSRADQTAS